MLVLARDSTYADRLRAYKVIIDGKKAGEIRDGEIKSFNLPPGNHTIMLRIDWARSQKLSFQYNGQDDVFFRCVSSVGGGGNFSRGLSVYYHATVGRNNYISLEQVQQFGHDLIERIDYRRTHPITEMKGFTVTKVFYFSLIFASVLFMATWLINSPYNFVTHSCYAPRNQQVLSQLSSNEKQVLDYYFGPKGYCKDGTYSEQRRSWMLVSETMYWFIGLSVPIILSSGLIKVYRTTKTSSTIR